MVSFPIFRSIFIISAGIYVLKYLQMVKSVIHIIYTYMHAHTHTHTHTHMHTYNARNVLYFFQYATLRFPHHFIHRTQKEIQKYVTKT
jgi:hypothetical protein